MTSTTAPLQRRQVRDDLRNRRALRRGWSCMRDLPMSPATGPSGLPIVDAAAFGERFGRLAAGTTLIVGAVATVAVSLIDDGSPRAVLLLAWVAAAVAYVVGRSVGRRFRFDPGLVRRSLCVPLIGVSLTAPLTMHAMLSLVIGASADDFRGWVLFSLVLTAQSHLLLAALASTSALRQLEGRTAPSTLQILVLCVLSATAPVGVFAIDFADAGEVLALAVFTVALQIAVLGPAFMVPMMRMARAAARTERALRERIA